MNNKGVLTDWRAKLLYPVLKLIDLLLSVRPVAAYLFDRVRDRANLEAVLKAVYANDAAVDDELVDIIASPADDPAALDVFVSVITGEALFFLCGRGLWVLVFLIKTGWALSHFNLDPPPSQTTPPP
jgi:hypothetical protein